MTRSWEIAAFDAASTAHTTPTLSRRRGIQFRAASELVHDSESVQLGRASDTPFPTKPATADEESAAASEPQPHESAPSSSPRSADTGTQRTVRRKKSSLDLRDVFRVGATMAAPAQPSPST